MVQSYGNRVEKVTFNIPVELKERVNALKEELHVSYSTIYNEAIAEYLKRKEIERWQKGAQMALEDKAYMESAESFASDTGELYEY